MRWPRLTRRNKGTAPSGRSTGYTPGTWAQAAMPDLPSMVMPPPEPGVTVIPADVAVQAPPAAVPAPLVGPPVPTHGGPAYPEAAPNISSAVRPAFAYPDPPVPSPPLPMSSPVSDPPKQPGQPAVRLGFADGSDLHLDPEDPHTIALKAVADVLVAGENDDDGP